MNKVTKEMLLWILMLLPYVYLWMLWDQLPERVATHFNLQGDADGWSSRSTLLYLPLFINVGIYFLLLFLPAIDPKKKIQQMGDKFYMIRLIIVAFMSALSIYIIYAAKAGSMTGPNFLFILMGAFFAGLGNYMPVMRPNYFVGIRTPWTLENEAVWKSTHQLGGKIWMGGGLLIILLCLVLHDATAITFAFICMVVLMAAVPVVYSYLEFKRVKEHTEKTN